jgi:hypothetical protein
MALNDSDLEGFELVATQSETSTAITVSRIPQALVNLLEKEAPKALENSNYELVLRVPVKAPEPTVLSEEDVNDDLKVMACAATFEAYVNAETDAISVLKQLTLYAAAWGKGQDPKLYIHKIPNRRDMPKTVARLKVEKWDDVPKENRPGRSR